MRFAGAFGCVSPHKATNVVRKGAFGRHSWLCAKKRNIKKQQDGCVPLSEGRSLLLAGAPARAFNLYGNERAGNSLGSAESHVRSLRRTAVPNEGDLHGRPWRIEPGSSDQPIGSRGVVVVDLGDYVARA